MSKKYHIFLCLLFISFFCLTAKAEKISIDQDLNIIYEKNNLSLSSVIHILIKGGMVSEPEQRKGLAYLTTSLSIGIIDSNKRKLMTQMGSSLAFQIEGDFSLITINCLSSHLEQTLKIVFEVLDKPLFSSFRINRIKAHMKHQQTAEKDETIRLMGLNQRLIFFNKRGYGSSIYGDPESVENIKKKDILKYYQSYFNRENLIVGISSSLEKSRIKDIFNRTFPKLSQSKKTTYPVHIPITPIKKRYHFQKNRKQTLIAYVISAPDLGPKKFALAFVLENLLGKGIGSILWYLREQKKLAYHVNANLWQVKNAGIMNIYLKTDNLKRDQAHHTLEKILNDLYKNGIDSDKLQTNKNHAKADFLRLLETSKQRIFLRAFFDIMEMGYSYIDLILSEIEKITLNEFNSYIKKILHPENRILIIIGPEDISSSI